MKPSFALDFRDGVIALLHRTTRGWQTVGASPLDAADLGDALAYLRSTALGLSPRGLSTKLVIPNEMILYTQVYAPGPEVAKRRKQIRAALEGLTPYKTEDLVFDWHGTGPEVQVAVVARETLAEAEAFAVEHRFNPVSFVGAPENASYVGEPFFGPSALSATLLAEGEKVERDQDPVTGLVREFGKRPEVSELALAEKPAELPPVAPVAAPARPERVIAKASEPAARPATVMNSDPVVMPEAARPEPDAYATVEPLAKAEPLNAASITSPLPDFTAAKVPEKGVASFDPAKLALDLVDEAPMAVDVADDAPPRSFSAPTSARTEPSVKPAVPDAKPEAKLDDVPPSPTEAVIAAFASRRAASLGAADDKSRKQPSLGPAPQQRPSVPRPTMAKAAAQPVASREAVPFPKGTDANSRFPMGKGTKPLNSGFPMQPIKRDRNVVQLPKQPLAEGEGTPATKPMGKTATGLDGRPVAPRGKPRYLGLILTALLLLALALVAAWSSFFMTSNATEPDTAPTANAVAAITPDPAPADVTDAVPSAEDEALADGQDIAGDSSSDPAPNVDLAGDASATSQAAPDSAASGTDVVATDPAPIAAIASAEPAVAAPEPAPGTVVVTEAAQASAAGNDPQDEIFLADADTPPQTSDPLALPQLVVGTDPPPDAVSPPPPFGMLYTFDAEGRIQPTPEGVITPEGFLLVAGAPKLVPPDRPAALTTPVVAAATTATDAAMTAVAPAVSATGALTATAAPAASDLGATTAATPSTAGIGSTSAAPAVDVAAPVYADPALANKRPKPRPAGLVDPVSATAKQGEALAPAANSRFASVRPQVRPAAMTTAVAQAADAEQANGAASASLALNGVKPSALAVAVSKVPAARPSGMNQAVNAAVAAAVRAPEPQQQTASAAPEAQAEPEVETAAPAMPTNASVAKQATTKDALNMSRVALLGIFGTASGRYAMVRQPSGGVKRVKVGDSIDGGRVAAISANALQYQKGGRMVTLSMPTG